MHPELEQLPQGWFHHGDRVLDLLEAYRPAVVVELGTWRGASAIAMARVLRQWGGVITCVDTWTGDVNGTTAPGMPAMLLECAHNLIAAGVAASVRLVPVLTTEAAEWWHGPIDCLYIDADHSHAACLADLRAWVPLVRPGGLILGDDYGNTMYPGVKAAWDEYERETGLTFTRGPVDPLGMQLIYGEQPIAVAA